MATRTIHNRRDRFTTILVAPLMSCSARLPVYVIMIAAFIPATTVGGIFSLQGLVLFAMYMLGILVAVPVAWTIKRFLFKGEKPPFLLEMPSYKLPKTRTLFYKVYGDAREFIIRAGTLICAVTILVWALAYFPHDPAIAEQYALERQAVTAAGLDAEEAESRLAEIDNLESGAYLRSSVLGRFGHAIEPIFRPLGWDWRIATATIASFPAREIIVATLGTLFNMGGEADESSPGLIERLRGATAEDGTPLFTIPVALSIMVFFALCCQCAATLVTIKRETKQWRWPALTFFYMTTLAYCCAFATYQVTRALGWGT
jgi:ferrous iron transport protein B